MVAALFVGCSDSTDKPGETGNKPADGGEKLKIAMVTDYGDITDESFNQATYEGAKAWSEENGADFIYYKPTDDSTEARVTAINKAIDEGNQVIVMPGYAFAGAIVETVEKYPDVKFIALDVSEYDLQAAKHPDQVAKNEDFPFDWKYPANLYSAVYQEELAGYMAGVAAVKLGYTKLGFLGGMAVPAVIRYGYGFVQGANDAAVELGNTADVSINYVYGNQFSGDADITAYMDTWYGNGTEVVFACGGGIYTSAADAAKKVDGKVIGVDVDQAPTIDSKYAEGMTVTSAMKGLAATVKTLLGKVQDGSFEGGKVENLGLVSETPADNYVQLPASTQWADGFTEADYNALVADLFNGKITVSNDTENAPAVDIAVDYQGNIK
jgi:basic membrane protein A